MNDKLYQRLDSMKRAYKLLYEGAGALLEVGPLYWTERLLLRVVYTLYERRLQQLGEILPDGE